MEKNNARNVPEVDAHCVIKQIAASQRKIQAESGGGLCARLEQLIPFATVAMYKTAARRLLPVAGSGFGCWFAGACDSALFAPSARIEVLVGGVRDAETWQIRVTRLENIHISAGQIQA